MSDVNQIMEALIAGDKKKVIDKVQDALQSGMAGKNILDDGLIKAMDIVGEKMETGEMFIPEVLMSAKIMGAAIDILKPHLPEGGTQSAGRIVVGTVKGDLHDIGKNLVVMMLESAGFQVFDIGIDAAPEVFVKAIKENNANLVGLSALLTTTMPMMKKTIDALVESGLRDHVKIIIGGAPVTQKFADEINADGFVPDAGSGVRLAKQLVE